LLADHGVPTRDDLRRLAEQLDALATKLEEISPDAP
jgi:hypothetical protein